jgi:RNA polymerase-associated protein RTF1
MLKALGSYVRLMAGDTDEHGRPKYRIHRIIGELQSSCCLAQLRCSEINDKHNYGRYNIEYKGRNIMDTRALLCSYGKAQRLFRIADVSNGDFEEVRATSMNET